MFQRNLMPPFSGTWDMLGQQLIWNVATFLPDYIVPQLEDNIFLGSWCILTQVLWNSESFLPSNVTNCPSSQIISLCLPCLDHCFIIKGFVFLMTSGFLWHNEWHTVTDSWGCQTCEARSNEPLVWNMVSIMKWSIAKDSGYVWTIKLYLTVSTAVCFWRSRLLRAFIDQLLTHRLFQISVA